MKKATIPLLADVLKTYSQELKSLEIEIKSTSVEMLETLLDWDVDAITSNRPSLALDFLRKRGIL